ncbi:MAG: serine hydrolase [Pseudomonadota bacterium]
MTIPDGQTDPTPPLRRGDTDLANWRTAPHSRWAFHHVRELVPSAVILAGDPAPFGPAQPAAAALDAAIPEAEQTLTDTETTGLVVLHRGRLAHEDYRLGYTGLAPHIVFSISKSVSGLLTGILAAEGALAVDDLVTRWVPEAAGSAYDGATLRHLLDMTVSTGFEESYLDTTGDYVRYREATAWNPIAGGRAPSDLRSFLAGLRPSPEPHGGPMHYVSPNSDMLGWVLERASGRPYADLCSDLLWQPLGAEAAAEVTVDRFGAPRSAGGISIRPRDLARLGEMMRLGGQGPRGQVVPEAWVAGIRAHDGDTEGRASWVAGDMRELFPDGSYRAQWYRSGHPSGAFAAVGIHGQWLWVDPAAEVVIAKASAQTLPIDDALDQRTIALFVRICAWLSGASGS